MSAFVLFNQSNHLKHSNKDCDWLILAALSEYRCTLTPLLFVRKMKFVLKMRVNAGGNKGILYHKTNKEASTVLCSVVKHLGSSQSTQEVGRNTRLRVVFPPTLLSCSSRFLRALQQNRAQSRLLYLLTISINVVGSKHKTTRQDRKVIWDFYE